MGLSPGGKRLISNAIGTDIFAYLWKAGPGAGCTQRPAGQRGAQSWAPGSPTREGSVGAQMSGLRALLLLPSDLLGWGFSPCTPRVPNDASGERLWRQMWC